jgi:hypothetical protein
VEERGLTALHSLLFEVGGPKVSMEPLGRCNLMVFGYRALSKTFGPKKDKVTGD